MKIIIFGAKMITGQQKARVRQIINFGAKSIARGLIVTARGYCNPRLASPQHALNTAANQEQT